MNHPLFGLPANGAGLAADAFCIHRLQYLGFFCHVDNLKIKSA
jgi:hypothetical protein